MMTTTLKGTTVALGVGLAILWIAGLSSPYAPGWLTWLDGVAAVAAFGISGTMKIGDSRARRMGNMLGLSAALYALGIIGLATGALAWLSWWTFAFACVFLILGISAGNLPSAEAKVDSPDSEEDERNKRFKKTG